ncbi:hypothetical protein [Corynebacterium alimapuense]|uniref:Polysaccharide biosynthesis protein n=1 Tax=Corynebacterium alimapuense TaxID=1576874 RepID=A0A3M8K7Z4_9CORY|nr:hypothetical protein [Corynebacterium alimapuense]RNE48989.1 hypothetical protein C5L39_06815 [Corynebacterium alimapuense]
MRSLGLATVFAALAGFIVIYVASWTLGNDGYAAFQAYWGLFFAATGFLDGLMQETTRAVAASRQSGRVGGGRPWRLGLLVAGCALVGASVLGVLWLPTLIRGQADTSTATAFFIFGLVSYAFQSVLSGILSGLGLWRNYAWLVALDSGIRLLLALVAWRLGGGLSAFMLITVIGALSWLLILAASPTVRSRLLAPVDVDQQVLLRRVGSAMLATGASATLITGYPVFVQSTSAPDAGTVVTVAGIINAVTLTRAPILVPLQRFQSALIVRFVNQRDRLIGALVAPVFAVLGVGLLGGGVAWLSGPWILENFFREGLQVPGGILAILTFASACTGTLMVTGTAALAAEEHRAYVLGWMSASAVTFGVLWLAPWPLAATVCASLIIGPLIGCLVHLGALMRVPQDQTQQSWPADV